MKTPSNFAKYKGRLMTGAQQGHMIELGTTHPTLYLSAFGGKVFKEVASNWVEVDKAHLAKNPWIEKNLRSALRDQSYVKTNYHTRSAREAYKLNRSNTDAFGQKWS